MHVAKTIEDNRFRTHKPMPVLSVAGPVVMKMTAFNGPIGHMVIKVRDAEDKDLSSAGDDATALDTRSDSATWTFDPGTMNGARYVIWNMWASYTGPRPLQFDIEVTAAQGVKMHKSTITVRMEANENIVRISNNGDFLAIGTAYP